MGATLPVEVAVEKQRTQGREAWSGFGLGAALGLLVERLGLPAVLSWWGDHNWMVLAAALLGAAASAPRARLALARVVAALVAVWALVAFTPLTSWLAGDVVRSDAPARADAVFPLSSRVQQDGDLTCASQSRLIEAVALIAEGRADRLVISELPAELGGSHAEAARRMMARLGVSAELIVVGPVTRTRDEALAVSAAMRERGLTRLLVVSSPTHTRRAAAAMEEQGLQVVAVPAAEARFDLESLDRPGERVSAFESLLHERLGLAWYRWRGWIDRD